MKTAKETKPTKRQALQVTMNFNDSVDLAPISARIQEAVGIALKELGFEGKPNASSWTYSVPTPCEPVDATNEKMTDYHLLVNVDRNYNDGEVHGQAKCRTTFLASIFGSSSHAKNRKRCPKCYDEAEDG